VSGSPPPYFLIVVISIDNRAVVKRFGLIIKQSVKSCCLLRLASRRRALSFACSLTSVHLLAYIGVGHTRVRSTVGVRSFPRT
jgi:hypothetical protein